MYVIEPSVDIPVAGKLGSVKLDPFAQERVRLRGRVRGIVDSERLDGVEDFRVRDAVLSRMKRLAQARFGSNPS